MKEINTYIFLKIYINIWPLCLHLTHFGFGKKHILYNITLTFRHSQTATNATVPFSPPSTPCTLVRRHHSAQGPSSIDPGPKPLAAALVQKEHLLTHLPLRHVGGRNKSTHCGNLKSMCSIAWSLLPNSVDCACLECCVALCFVLAEFVLVSCQSCHPKTTQADWGCLGPKQLQYEDLMTYDSWWVDSCEFSFPYKELWCSLGTGLFQQMLQQYQSRSPPFADTWGETQ